MSSNEIPTSERIDRLERLVEQNTRSTEMNTRTIDALIKKFDEVIQTVATMHTDFVSFRSEIREQHTLMVELITSRLPPPQLPPQPE